MSYGQYWWRHPRVQALIRFYQKLSRREQNLIVLTLHVVLAFALLAALVWPLFGSLRQAYTSSEAMRAENQALSVRLDALRTQTVVDPNQPLRDELLASEAQQALLDERISRLTRALIPPSEMTALLGRVLEQNPQLRPTSLVALPAEKVNLGEGFSDVDLYRHGLRLTMTTTYPALVSYLQQLDQSPWTIGWESMIYNVSQYPDAQLMVEVSALSRQPEVLGGH